MSSLLKIIAVITMICDHVGLLLFPEVQILRIIGRLSLPIFCYMIAQGFKYTKNFKQYVITLSVLAVISEITFMLMQRTDLNILFAFVLALAILKLKDIIGRWSYVLIFAALILNIEYGIYSVILVIVFHEFEEKKLLLLYLVLMASLIFAFSINVLYQALAVLSVFIIWYVPKVNLKISKYVFYAVYPVQWLILIILKVYVIQ